MIKRPAEGLLRHGRLLRDFSVYVFSEGLNSAIPFLLLPLLTRFLTREDYGLVAVYNVLLSITVVLTGVNLQGSIAREYFNTKKIRMDRYVGTCATLMGLLVVGVGLVYLGLAPWVERAFNFPAVLMGVVLLNAVGGNILATVMVYFRVREKPWGFGAYTVTGTAIDYGLTVFFVVACSMDWKGRILGLNGKVILMGLVGVLVLVRGAWLRPCLQKDYAVRALKFGVPLIPHRLGMLSSHFVDRLLIAYWLGLDAAGVFSVGANIGRVLIVIQEAFINAWMPWAFKKLTEGSAHGRRVIVLSAYGYMVGMALCAGLLVVLARVGMPFLVGSDFQDALLFIPWLAMAYVFSGISRMFAGLIQYTRRTHYLSAVTLSTGVLNIVLVSILLKFNGAVGAAQATFISYGLAMLLVWLVATRLLPLPWLSFWKQTQEDDAG